MAWLRLRRIANKSTETGNCYQCLKRELRWLWNSVYMYEVKNSFCDKHDAHKKFSVKQLFRSEAAKKFKLNSAEH